MTASSIFQPWGMNTPNVSDMATLLACEACARLSCSGSSCSRRAGRLHERRRRPRDLPAPPRPRPPPPSIERRRALDHHDDPRRPARARPRWLGSRAAQPFECATLDGARRLPGAERRHARAGPREATRRRSGAAHRHAGDEPGRAGRLGVRRVERGFTLSDEVAAAVRHRGLRPARRGREHADHLRRDRARLPLPRPGTGHPAEEAALATAAEAVADECAVTEGARLAHLGTVDVARDLEVIRRAIGEPTISFVGLSYGTADRPALGGDVPRVGAGPGARRRGGSRRQQRGHLGRAGRPASKTAWTRSRAPARPMPRALWARPAGFDASYDELARRIEAGEVARDGVGPTQLAYAAFYATYDAEHWPRLWSAIADGLDGDLGAVAAMAASFTSLVPYATFALDHLPRRAPRVRLRGLERDGSPPRCAGRPGSPRSSATSCCRVRTGRRPATTRTADRGARARHRCW